MMCVSSVHYSIIVNHDDVGPVLPTRGLRQGDPLSPYLYIICTEGLSCLLKDAELKGHIHGIKNCRGAPIISHLLFADDSFLFLKAKEEEMAGVKEIFHLYRVLRDSQ